MQVENLIKIPIKSCVNALSSFLKAEVHREGKIYTQEYAAGIPQTEVKEVGTTDVTGTIVTFVPDGIQMVAFFQKYSIITMY